MTLGFREMIFVSHICVNHVLITCVNNVLETRGESEYVRNINTNVGANIVGMVSIYLLTPKAFKFSPELSPPFISQDLP